jgi:hypothetical protein
LGSTMTIVTILVSAIRELFLRAENPKAIERPLYPLRANPTNLSL